MQSRHGAHSQQKEDPADPELGTVGFCNLNAGTSEQERRTRRYREAEAQHSRACRRGTLASLIVHCEIV